MKKMEKMEKMDMIKECNCSVDFKKKEEPRVSIQVARTPKKGSHLFDASSFFGGGLLVAVNH